MAATISNAKMRRVDRMPSSSRRQFYGTSDGVCFAPAPNGGSMAGEGKELRQLARYQVKAESLERCLAAIHEFVAYVRANESGTLRYDVWQEKDDPTRFVHIFTFR